MSRIDYSRFDHIGDSDDDDAPSKSDSANSTVQQPNLVQSQAFNQPQTSGAVSAISRSETTKEGRIQYKHDGKVIYEWEQTIDEVNIYIWPPAGVTSQRIFCEISAHHVRLGLKGTPPFIDEDTAGVVIQEESFWTLADGELIINLQKAHKAEMWNSALKGRGGEAMDPFTAEETKKKMMLERFQQEHPAFDFSGAEFNGSTPDARSFMGGVKYT